MRTILCVSLVLLIATTASAQVGGKKKAVGAAAKATEAEPAKAGDAPPDQPAPPPADAAAGGAAAPNAIFVALDADGDGMISKRELGKAVAALKKLDADNDGNISLAECGGGAAAPQAGANVAGNDPNQWLERIMASDKNGDGKLTADEVPDTIKPMLQGADQNGDGAIDRAELTAAMDRGNNGGPGTTGGRFNTGGTAALGGGRAGNQAMRQFFQYDANGDGRLTANEVPQQMRGMLRGGDTNGDGAIDAAELAAVSARMGDRMRAAGAGVDPNGAPSTQGNGGRFNKRPPNNEK